MWQASKLNADFDRWEWRLKDNAGVILLLSYHRYYLHMKSKPALEATARLVSLTCVLEVRDSELFPPVLTKQP